MKNLLKTSVILLLFFFIYACGPSKSVAGKTFKNKAEVSYYHDKFNGRKTASGEKFSNSKYTAAHRKLPFGTRLRITNLANNESVDVTVNDRGPFKRSRELDLSRRAFMDISDNKNHGTLKVRITFLK